MRAGLGVLVVAWAVVGQSSAALAAGDANMPSCTNEGASGFRATLPDCRAYELVTPPDMGDYYTQPLGALAADGGQLLGASLGAVEGVASHVFAGTGSPYSFTRRSSGWATAPLLTTTAGMIPPSGQLPHVTYIGADMASGRTAWEAQSDAGAPGQKEDTFYQHEQDGSFAKIGPRYPAPLLRNQPGAVGASADLSRILFSNEMRPGEPSLWPGDTTNERNSQSLYEYSGTGEVEPKLVGVRNQKPLARNTEAELISQCGTGLGGPSGTGDKYNAISAGGNTVFFTAMNRFGNCATPMVNELYARLDASKTVSISEPSKSDCSVCNTTVGLENAAFLGASEDGSKVFFMTSQELVPGAKGSNLYEYDFANAPATPERPMGRIVLVSAGASEPEVQGVLRVSESGSHVYFVAGGKLTGPNPQGNEPVAGNNNLYVFERDGRFPAGHLAFIGALSGADRRDWDEGDGSRPAEATPDGRYLVFVSAAPLTPDDASTVGQVFEYDAKTEALVRLSVGQRSSRYPGGYNENGNSQEEPDAVTIVRPYFGNADVPTMAAGTLTVSNDGHYVFFQTPLALTPQASNNRVVGHVCFFESEGVCLLANTGYAQNVYEYRWTGEDISDGNVYLVSDGQDVSPFKLGEAVELLGTDASGTNVFFTTTNALVSADGNGQQDIYDARVGGGFAEPVTSPGCAGESCRGSLSAPPALTPAASMTQTGEPPIGQPSGGLRPAGSGHTRAQLLARALRRCKRRPRRQRAACRRQAMHRYAGGAKTTNSRGRSK